MPLLSKLSDKSKDRLIHALISAISLLLIIIVIDYYQSKHTTSKHISDIIRLQEQLNTRIQFMEHRGWTDIKMATWINHLHESNDSLKVPKLSGSEILK